MMMKNDRLVQTQFSFKRYIPFVRETHTNTKNFLVCTRTLTHTLTNTNTHRVKQLNSSSTLTSYNLKLCSSILLLR